MKTLVIAAILLFATTFAHATTPSAADEAKIYNNLLNNYDLSSTPDIKREVEGLFSDNGQVDFDCVPQGNGQKCQIAIIDYNRDRAFTGVDGVSVLVDEKLNIQGVTLVHTITPW